MINKIKAKPSTGIIFYTDNEASPKITLPVQENLIKIAKNKNIPIVTASLHRKLDFGVKNIYFPSLKRSMLTQFKQIYAALEHSTASIVFFCEADVLYHPSHFDFIPQKKEVYYYNVNVWKIRWSDGHAFKTDDFRQLSGLCGDRDFLLEHYRKRIATVLKRIKDLEEKNLPIKNQGVSRYMGFEPGRESYPRGVDNFPTEAWRSEFPNIDIRHNHNISKNRWVQTEFPHKDQLIGWIESTADKIPGWEETLEKIRTQ